MTKQTKSPFGRHKIGINRFSKITNIKIFRIEKTNIETILEKPM